MYQPDHFRVDDVAQMHGLMRERPFAALVSAGAAGLYGSHLPTVLKDDGDFESSNATSRAPIRIAGNSLR
jgi:transcriptional regulator